MGKSSEIKKDPWDPIVEDAAKGLASVVELAEEIAQKMIERRNQAVSGRLISAWFLSWIVLLIGGGMGIPGWKGILEKWLLLHKAFWDLVVAAGWWIPGCFFAWAFGYSWYREVKRQRQSKD